MEDKRTSPKLFSDLPGRRKAFGGDNSLQAKIVPLEAKQNQENKAMWQFAVKGKARPHSLAESLRRLPKNVSRPFLYEMADLSFDKGRKKRAEFRGAMFQAVTIYLLSNLCLINMTIGIHDNKNNFIYRTKKAIARALNTSEARISRYIAYLEKRGYVGTQVTRKPVYSKSGALYWQNDTIITIQNKFFEALHIDQGQLAKDQARAMEKYRAIESRLEAKLAKVEKERSRIIAKEKRSKKIKLDHKKIALIKDPGRGKRIHEFMQQLVHQGHSIATAFELAKNKFPPD